MPHSYTINNLITILYKYEIDRAPVKVNWCERLLISPNNGVLSKKLVFLVDLLGFNVDKLCDSNKNLYGVTFLFRCSFWMLRAMFMERHTFNYFGADIEQRRDHLVMPRWKQPIEDIPPSR